MPKADPNAIKRLEQELFDDHKNLDPRAYESLPLDQVQDADELPSRLAVLAFLITAVGFVGSMWAKGWDSCTKTVFECGTWGAIFGAMMVGPALLAVGAAALVLLVGSVWYVVTGRWL